MKFDDQCMVVFVKLEQLGSQRWLLGEIEGLAQKFPCLPLDRRCSCALGTRSHVEVFEPRRRGSCRLQRFTHTFEEGRSQHLVALADHRDARPQGVEIERARQTGRFEDMVVIPCRIERAQDMDSLLLEGQADAAAFRRRVVQARGYRGGIPLRRLKASREGRHGRRIEDIFEREIDAQTRSQTRKHLRYRN
jgi:hypothetical protein